MTGKQLFDKYQTDGRAAHVGSEEREYGGLLLTALMTVGKEELFAKLEEAEKTGKKVALTYPAESVPAEPNGIMLVD
ncbi:hypothetical protein BWI93_08645 [Siphonobacter sp. BAB-5385]|uniref:hypothetical protein n=1 Tax=Siphonobacter sp. BAB-5385 TaxID=1864822 RepID=UPI000B9E5D95|nr:hypothetical protein [Siphonobacter sp. BAB-5385]OZI08553.1 hypothetical protein BWI93_08645 [Siphonobacter sp. BAB-5385]